MTKPKTVPVRRFERGASAMGFDAFLQERGYQIRGNGNGSSFIVKAPGQRKSRSISRRMLIELLDRERVAAGLEPISLAHVPEA